ncbi:MAG: prolipoprotein diacylglyceryl transferase [Anaerolineae bacterium]|nr:MAG: prolipoprotein diacylglyceryl transferase [Anaerolineae bacterium]
MFPPVVRLGPLHVAWSSISLVVGLAAGVAWLCWRAKTPEQRWRDTLRLVIDTYGPVGLVAVVVGRLVYVLVQGSYFIEHPAEALVVWQGGISAQGAVLGLLLGLSWRFRTWPTWLRAADALTAPVVLVLLAGWLAVGWRGVRTGRWSTLVGSRGWRRSIGQTCPAWWRRGAGAAGGGCGQFGVSAVVFMAGAALQRAGDIVFQRCWPSAWPTWVCRPCAPTDAARGRAAAGCMGDVGLAVVAVVLGVAARRNGQGIQG